MQYVSSAGACVDFDGLPISYLHRNHTADQDECEAACDDYDWCDGYQITSNEFLFYDHKMEICSCLPLMNMTIGCQ